MIPSGQHLRDMPTLETEGTSLLKIHNSSIKVWYNDRMKPQGAPFEVTIYVEVWDEEEHSYREVIAYDGDNPPEVFPHQRVVQEHLERSLL